MAELSLNDIEQLYVGSICKFRDEVVRVNSVNQDRDVTITLLQYNKKARVHFNREDFTPTRGRIGFVNEGGHALYVTRQPVRRYSVGITSYNISIKCLPNYRVPSMKAADSLLRLNTKPWSQALKNEYPTLSEAIQIAKDTQGSCAFDKQFAVDKNRVIYFKTQAVGHIPPRMSTTKRIILSDEFSHLELLLKQNYDETLRTISV